MAIEPDTKSWTWVLEARCPECGFDAGSVRFRDVAALMRENAAAWPAELAREDVRMRPDDSTWSPLEYGAHVRDVFARFDTRLRLVLTEDDPTFADWDQDATAIEDRYDLQDPATVAEAVVRNADQVARALEAVADADLGRRGVRSDGSVFTVDSLARYVLHDPVHHLADVRR